MSTDITPATEKTPTHAPEAAAGGRIALCGVEVLVLRNCRSGAERGTPGRDRLARLRVAVGTTHAPSGVDRGASRRAGGRGAGRARPGA